MKFNSKNSKFAFESMEPRLLFSADLDGGLVSGAPDTHAAMLDPALTQELGPSAGVAPETHDAADTRQELVIVDIDTPDYQQLIDDLVVNQDGARNLEVILLDNTRDGIHQITEILSYHRDLDAVHIISHGTDGAIDLGGGTLDSDSLQANTGLIETWGEALTAEADLLIYGCNLAESQAGQSLVTALAELTGADVAASDDLTGSAALGGDWELEYTTGHIDAAVAVSATAQQNWDSVLTTFLVNTTADTVDANPGDGNALDASGNISLRAAIIEANSLGGSHTIILPAGNYNLGIAGAGEAGAWQGDLDISTDITIIGADSATTIIDGKGLDRVFEVRGASGVLTMSDVTITGGSVSGDGGGIYVKDGGSQMSLNRVIITNNLADDGAGIFNNGTMTLTDVVISNNGDPGTAEGGGIHNKAVAILNGVTLSGNRANDGGGIHNDNTATSLTLTNVTVSGNTASGKGGGLHAQSDANIVNSTFTLNSASNGGGISENGGTVTVKNSIIAGNTAGSAPDFEGNVDSQGNNLVGDDTGSTGFTGADFKGTSGSVLDPKLGALAANGGFTPTHALLAGSVAIDNGNDTGAPATDQRGMARVGTTDIGAFEAGATALTAVDDSATTDEDTPVVINVLSNDSGTATVLDYTLPANGAVTDNGDGTLTYTPDSGYTGPDSFQYLITDGTDGSQHYWKLDGDAQDSVGSLDGTVFEATPVAGQYGGALAFDEVDDYVQIPDVSYASDFTVSFRFKVDDNSGFAHQYLYSHGAWTSQETLNISIGESGELLSPDHLMTNIRDINDTLDPLALNVDIGTSGLNLIGDGQWHTYTLTVESGVGSKVYIDSALENSSTRGADGLNPVSDVLLGARSDLDPAKFYGGELDSVLVFDRTLSGPDADSLHAGTLLSTSTATVNVTVNAANTQPVAGDVAVNATEDGLPVTGSFVLVSDPDAADTHTFDITGTPAEGSVVNNNDGTFSFDPGGDFQDLAFGATRDVSFTYTVTDSSGAANATSASATVTVTVTGTNDAASIGGTDTGAVTEDVDPDLDGLLETGSALTISDADTGEATFTPGTLTGTYGDLTLDAAGNWYYSADKTQASIQSLAAGATLNDTIPVTTADGTTHDVVITITGANDAAVIGGADTAGLTEDVDPDLDGLLETSGALTVADVDTGEAGFTAGTLNGTYGDLTIDTAGNWTYAADNTQAAIQSLDAGESISDTLTVTTTDGTTHDVVITINGAEDTSVIGGSSTGVVTEDGTLVASDTLTITDVDTSDNPVSFNDVAATLGDNGYGDFEITGNTWTYTLNNASVAVQALDAGETLNDTYTFTATDGSTQVVTVTINGAEDAPVIGGTAAGAVTEDGTLTASNTLTITDVDTSDNPISFNDVLPTPGDNGYGNFEVTGNTWTYTLNNALAAVQSLDAGETLSDTFTFTAPGGANRIVTITINGAEDASVIGGVDTGVVTEDLAVTAGKLTAGGALTLSDIDTSDNPVSFNAGTVAGTYGDLILDAAGNWSYAADNTQSAIQSLAAGATLTDTLTVTAADGGTHDVVITINGTDDAPVIGGVDTGALTEDLDPDLDGLLETSGAMSIMDADSGEANFTTGTVAGTYGSITLDAAGNWSYAADNTQAVIQNLAAGATLTDTLTVSTVDGTTHDVVITITGANDSAVIDGDKKGNITEHEDPDLDGLLEVSGVLTIVDADAGESTFMAGTIAGTYGNLTIDAAGNWSYAADKTQIAITSLNPGDKLTDTLTVTSADGTTQDIEITFHGTNSSATIGGGDTGSVTEDVDPDLDGLLETGGVLTISDLDTGEDFFISGTIAGTYGNLTLDAAGNWSYAADNTQAAIQNLGAGATLTDIVTITSADSTNYNVVITINGAADAAVIGGVDSGSVTEDVDPDLDGLLETGGTLTISDSDPGEDSFTAATITGTYGDLSIDAAGNWTYAADNTRAAIQALASDTSLTDVFTVTSVDGTGHVVTLTLNGSNDTAVISGVDSGAMTEDVGVVGGNLTTAGQLIISDTDSGEAGFAAGTVSGAYGDLSIDAAGSWSYQALNSQTAIQSLAAGATLTDILTVSAIDGTTHDVVVTITGINDAPTVARPITDKVAGIDTLFSFTFALNTFDDVDGDNLTFTATLGDGSALPGWLSFNAATRTLSGTPTIDDLGVITLKITADDGRGGTVSDVFTLEVSESPGGPVVIIEAPDPGPGIEPAPEPEVIDPPTGNTDPDPGDVKDPGKDPGPPPGIGGEVTPVPDPGVGDPVPPGEPAPDTDRPGDPKNTIPAEPGPQAKHFATTADFNYGRAGMTTKALMRVSAFVQELDEARQVMSEQATMEQRIVGSTMTVTTGLSVGYVIWLIRGGVLLSSVLSSLPAWRMIDPLPVLAFSGRTSGDDEDDDSLESLVRNGGRSRRPQGGPDSGGSAGDPEDNQE